MLKIFKNFLPFIFIFLISCLNYSNLRFGSDTYQDFYQMASDNIEGRDYSVEVYDRNSEVSVLAIHGGELEKAT